MVIKTFSLNPVFMMEIELFFLGYRMHQIKYSCSFSPPFFSFSKHWLNVMKRKYKAVLINEGHWSYIKNSLAWFIFHLQINVTVVLQCCLSFIANELQAVVDVHDDDHWDWFCCPNSLVNSLAIVNFQIQLKGLRILIVHLLCPVIKVSPMRLK